MSFEVFQDPSCFDMWCLRRKGEQEFSMTLHFADKVTAVHAQAVILELLRQEREACAELVDQIQDECVKDDVDDQPLTMVSFSIRNRSQSNE